MPSLRPVPSGADRGAQVHRELSCPCITVTAHLVAQIGESDVVIDISKSQLAARAGVPEARRPEHWLGGRRCQLEARPPAGSVIRKAGELRAGRLDTEEILQRPGRQESRTANVRNTRPVQAGKGLGGADAV